MKGLIFLPYCMMARTFTLLSIPSTLGARSPSEEKTSRDAAISGRSAMRSSAAAKVTCRSFTMFTKHIAMTPGNFHKYWKGFIAFIRIFRGKIVLVGMKTDLCVLQTGPNLPEAGNQLHLVADAVDFRTSLNRDIAIALFREAGAVIASAEIVMFQWARRTNR